MNTKILIVGLSIIGSLAPALTYAMDEDPELVEQQAYLALNENISKNYEQDKKKRASWSQEASREWGILEKAGSSDTLKAALPNEYAKFEDLCRQLKAATPNTLRYEELSYLIGRQKIELVTQWSNMQAAKAKPVDTQEEKKQPLQNPVGPQPYVLSEQQKQSLRDGNTMESIWNELHNWNRGSDFENERNAINRLNGDALTASAAGKWDEAQLIEYESHRAAIDLGSKLVQRKAEILAQRTDGTGKALIAAQTKFLDEHFDGLRKLVDMNEAQLKLKMKNAKNSDDSSKATGSQANSFLNKRNLMIAGVVTVVAGVIWYVRTHADELDVKGRAKAVKNYFQTKLGLKKISHVRA